MTNIPEHWTLTVISEVTEKIESTDPRKSPTCQFAYVDIGAIDNVSGKIVAPKTFLGAEAPSRARRVISEGDTLFSTVRTYLRNIAQVPAELEGQLTSTGIAVLRPGKAVTPDYLFKWVLHSEFVDEISKSQDGTMYPAVSDGDVAGGPIPIPPLPEQRRIVAKLDRLSARSATARDHLARTTKLATRAKQAIVKSHIWSKEWEVVPFLDACDAYQPKTVSRSELDSKGKYPVFGANGQIGRYHNYNHEEPQLLVTCRGATCGAVNVSLPHSWITGNAMVITGKKSNLSREFLRMYFSEGFDFSEVISGSAQPQITRQNLAKLKMPIIPPDEQAEIVQCLETAFARIDRLTEEASRAARLLDRLDERLLAKAFRGELVPQNPEDEPAEALLTRIRDARAAAPKPKRGRRKKAADV